MRTRRRKELDSYLNGNESPGLFVVEVDLDGGRKGEKESSSGTY